MPTTFDRLRRPALTGLLTLPLTAALCLASAPPAGPLGGPSLERYRLDLGHEIALARSAAPAEVADRATILVLGRSGYEVVDEGSNGFNCLVLRSWDGPSAEASPERFYDPSIRAPICFNPAASATMLQVHLRRSALVAAGESFEDVKRTVAEELARGELNFVGEGLAMAYMFSSAQNLGAVGAWKPHVMIYAPGMAPADAGGKMLGAHPFVLPPGGSEPPVLTIPVESFVDPANG